MLGLEDDPASYIGNVHRVNGKNNMLTSKIKYSPEINMEPENDGFQKECPFSRDFFSGSMLNFRGVHVSAACK